MNISIIELLDDVDFFHGFDHEEMGELLEMGHWVKVPDQKEIIVEGEYGLNMYVIIQGHVEVMINERILATLEIGDTFGEFGLVGERRTASVRAGSNCLLMQFTADHLDCLSIPLQIKFLKKLLFTLFARLQKVNRQIWWHLPTQWRSSEEDE